MDYETLIRFVKLKIASSDMAIKPITAQHHLSQIIKSKVGIDPSLVKESNVKESQSNRTSKILQSTPLYNSTESTLQRAQKRRKLALIRKQTNIETILTLAQQFCPAVTSQGEPDPDWVERFLELAEDTGNGHLQKLWAKVLAGEVINPGSFSYKSLITLKHFTATDADVLKLATACAGKSYNDGFHQIITGSYVAPSLINFLSANNKSLVNLSAAGLNYPDILTLIDIELIYQQEIESKAFDKGETLSLSFANGTLELIAKRQNSILTYYKFTQTGFSLARLTTNKISTHYLDCLKHALDNNFEVSFTSS
jgi:uncharacterized repeat protein (TIGR03899 family)